MAAVARIVIIIRHPCNKINCFLCTACLVKSVLKDRPDHTKTLTDIFAYSIVLAE